MIQLQYNPVQAEGEDVLEGGGHSAVNSTAHQYTAEHVLDPVVL